MTKQEISNEREEIPFNLDKFPAGIFHIKFVSHSWDLSSSQVIISRNVLGIKQIIKPEKYVCPYLNVYI